MKVYIMRGLPGSGKSTWIKRYLEQRREGVAQAICCSADHYHMVDGKYCYDPKNAGLAHNKCLNDYLQQIGVNTKDIVIDNTNTTLVELAPYVRIAEALGVEYEIIYLHCYPGTAIRRNTHNVPANTILAMYRNLVNEIVPSYWKQRIVMEEDV